MDKRVILSGLAVILLLCGCSGAALSEKAKDLAGETAGKAQEFSEKAKDLADEAASKAQEVAIDITRDSLNKAQEVVGGAIVGGLDALKEHGALGEHTFENEQQAQTYLLAELEKKYGFPFILVQSKSYTQYGPLYGDVLVAQVAPASAPEQTAWARATQSGTVDDEWAAWIFKEAAEQPFYELCAQKDYLKNYKVRLNGANTILTWTQEDSLKDYLSQHDVEIRVDLELVQELTAEEYADQIKDFLKDLEQTGRSVRAAVLLCVESENHGMFEGVLFFRSFDFRDKDYTLPDYKQLVEEIEEHLI